MMEQEFMPSQNSRRCYLIMGFIGLAIIPVLIYFGLRIWQDPSSSFFQKYIQIPLLFFVFLISTPSYLYNGFKMKIIINDKRIKFISFDYIVDSKWSSLIQIKKHYNADVENILVQSSAVKRNFGVRLTNEPLPDVIPVHLFAKYWRYSKLGQQIKRYAPHLFESAGD